MTCICTQLLFTRFYTQSKVVHQHGGGSVVTSRENDLYLSHASFEKPIYRLEMDFITQIPILIRVLPHIYVELTKFSFPFYDLITK